MSKPPPLQGELPSPCRPPHKRADTDLNPPTLNSEALKGRTRDCGRIAQPTWLVLGSVTTVENWLLPQEGKDFVADLPTCSYKPTQSAPSGNLWVPTAPVDISPWTGDEPDPMCR